MDPVLSWHIDFVVGYDHGIFVKLIWQSFTVFLWTSNYVIHQTHHHFTITSLPDFSAVADRAISQGHEVISKKIHHGIFLQNALTLLKYFALVYLVIWISHADT